MTNRPHREFRVVSHAGRWSIESRALIRGFTLFGATEPFWTQWKRPQLGDRDIDMWEYSTWVHYNEKDAMAEFKKIMYRECELRKPPVVLITQSTQDCK